MHHQHSNETHGEKARCKQHKNVLFLNKSWKQQPTKRLL